MAILATEPKNMGILCPEGTHQAVCYGAWDIGIQKVEWAGEIKYQRKVVVGWELEPRIEMPESDYHGKRFVRSRTYTLSLAEKSNMKRDLEAWRGKPFSAEEREMGFDVEKLIGANCLINIAHVEKDSGTYANIQAIMACSRGMEKMEAEIDQTPPKWVVEKQGIAISEEDLRQDPGPNTGPVDDFIPPPYTDDDLPF